MPKLRPFQDEMPVPDIVRPVSAGGSHQLSIVARPEKVRLHRDLPPGNVWCYRLELGHVAHEGRGVSYLGPTVEVQRGQAVTVAWRNGIPKAHTLPFEVIKVPNPDAAATLPVPENEPGRDGALPDAQDTMRVRLRSLQAALVTHLHGASVHADSDGWPDNTAMPGQAAHYTYPNGQAATMLWYHDHAMHVTRLNVHAGLAGLLLIRDAEERSLHLPAGRLELPLVIQDRNPDVDDGGACTGDLLHKTEVGDGPAEFFGPYTLVNGKIWPKASAGPQLHRLRVLNAANARTYRLMLLDEQGNSANGALWQIGSDQGLMERKVPVAADGLVLAPAERVDLLADFSGRKLYLWNTADAPFGDDPANKPEYDPTQDTLTHVEATTVIPIEAGAAGPKDTVRVNPGEMVGIAMTFGPFTGRFVYHCHILEHEDHDMMRPFVVVPPWVPHHDD